MSDIVAEFQGKYRFLSNFYPCIVQYEGLQYPSVEHAYQAAKTLDITDRQAIAKCGKAGNAKRAGKGVKLRDDWDTVKIDIMLDLLRMKFSYYDFAEKLLATENAKLVEGNWWNDRFWGVCRGEGQNHLGKLLMQVREEIR